MGSLSTGLTALSGAQTATQAGKAIIQTVKTNPLKVANVGVATANQIISARSVDAAVERGYPLGAIPGAVMYGTMFPVLTCAVDQFAQALQGTVALQNYNYWGRPETLEDHYVRHGEPFGARGSDEYAKMAHEFYLNRDQYWSAVDSGGFIRVYDPATNTFGSYTPDGLTRTFYKPDEGIDYWFNNILKWGQ